MNCRERERYIAEMIQDELLKLGEVECKILYWNIGFRESDIWVFNPDVVMTFPLTARPVIVLIARIKIICKATIVSFVTEGFVDPKAEFNMDALIGYYDFPKELVDYWGVWGSAYGNMIWDALKKKKRIETRDQIVVFGYPLWEYDHLHKIKKANIVEREVKKLADKSLTTVLVLSGFQEANKDRNAVLNSIDAYNQEADEVEFQHEIEKLLSNVQKIKQCRERYYTIVLSLIEKHPEITFVIKLHPKEMEGLRHHVGYNYDDFTRYDNVRLLTEESMVGMYIDKVDCVIHYGSTVAWEAYAVGIPAVKIELKLDDSKSLVEGYTPGAVVSNEEEILSYFKNFSKCFKLEEACENFLDDIFNFKRTKKYSPSSDIARFLYEHCKPMSCNTDVIISYAENNLSFKKSVLKGAIKKIVKMNLCAGIKDIGLVWRLLYF